MSHTNPLEAPGCDQHMTQTQPTPISPAPDEDVDISVIVPVLNEEESLSQLTEEVAGSLDSWVSGDGGTSWELIFVDDGSTDGTWDEVLRLAATDPRVWGLRMRRNYGKSAALSAGVRASRGEIVATLDGDLQDDPTELPGMIERLAEPADLVAGHKAQRRDPLGKRLASRVFNSITSFVTGLKLHDHNCGLKVGRREVFESAPLYGEMHRYFAAISHTNGYKVVEQAVNHRPRQHGHSKFGLERYARGGLDLLTVVALTRFSRRPAHLLGGTGLALGTIGMFILIYLSGIWLFTDQAIGNRPLLLMGVLLVLVAVQLTSLGLLAEMIVNREVLETDPLRDVTEWSNPSRPR